ncbi:Tachykinin-like peptides receptor 99D [Trichoplax sp. H2]|nr:Tachykinin-like peptides receptor 99D [Trichoplax sp. H2]|eukprot:RDD36767.1 Tachykinin-like peptides receptor 99D [Trichoplax sp. H2]
MDQINATATKDLYFKQALKGIIFSTLGLCGLIFNIIAVWTLILHATRKSSIPHLIALKDFESKITLLYLLINLSISDILNCFILTANYIYQTISVFHGPKSISYSSPSGNIICKIRLFCISLAITSSAITLALISLQRFHEVIHLLNESKTRKRNILIAVATWLIPMITSTLLAVIYGVTDPFPYYCIINTGSNFFIAITSIAFMCFTVVIPFTVITISYTGNYIVRYTMTRSMQLNNIKGKHSKLAWKGKDTVLPLIIITFLTFASFTPLVISFMLSSLSKIFHNEFNKNPKSDLWKFFQISRILTIIPGIINPFIYRIIIKALHQ